MLNRSSRTAAIVVAVVTILLVGIPLERTHSVTSTVNFLIPSITTTFIFAIITVGLNIQWGYTGIFNFGILAFFMLGAYVTAIITKNPPADDFSTYIGGFGERLSFIPFLDSEQWFPFLVAILVSAVAAGLLAFILGLSTLRLREDYLAILLIGVAEILRRVVIEEKWLVNGSSGMPGIPRPMAGWVSQANYKWVFLAIVLVILTLVAVLVELALRSPWGRVLRAIREDEHAVSASGKSVFAFKQQGFVFGAALMGVGGSLYAMQQGGVSPDTFTHFFATFIFWAMLIIGGSGNTLGAIVGTFVFWSLWSITLQIQGYDLPQFVESRIFYIRDFLVGAIIVGMLLLAPRGLLPETARVSRWLDKRVAELRRQEVEPASRQDG
ncbi:MAG: branched-chain amino acid ABC transporter permease [Thermomicrobiales bacterium]|nr:branched-chain amino acid ABC transporter permease [Thermomicrobiales bacterium]